MLSARSQGFSYTHVQKMERSLLFFAQKNQMSDTNGFFFHTFIFNSVFRTEFKRCIGLDNLFVNIQKWVHFFRHLFRKRKPIFFFGTGQKKKTHFQFSIRNRGPDRKVFLIKKSSNNALFDVFKHQIMIICMALAATSLAFNKGMRK